MALPSLRSSLFLLVREGLSPGPCATGIASPVYRKLLAHPVSCPFCTRQERNGRHFAGSFQGAGVSPARSQAAGFPCVSFHVSCVPADTRRQLFWRLPPERGTSSLHVPEGSPLLTLRFMAAGGFLCRSLSQRPLGSRLCAAWVPADPKLETTGLKFIGFLFSSRTCNLEVP